MMLRNGTVLHSRYRLEGRLAVGGMGEVWEGRDQVLDRAVAVKILRSELAEDDAFRRRFRAEARTAGRLPHAGIAAVYDYGETEVEGVGLAYLVMELVPGQPLSAIISQDGALGTDRTLDVVSQAARALHAAHVRGVIHRDVKPANLMVTPDGRVKVTDFGIARPQDHEPLTATGQVMGTAHYLAPELARGQAASPQSDVYALGVVAYECLAGHRPFEGDNQVAVATAHLREQPPPLPATIAPEVRQVVAAAMEKDPARRIPGADAFAAALEGLRWRSSVAGAVTEVVPDGGPLRTPADGLHGRGMGTLGALASSGTAAVAPPPVPDVLPPPSPWPNASAFAPATQEFPLQTGAGPGGPEDHDGPGRLRGGSGPGRPFISTPLLALIGLVVVVVGGGLLMGSVLRGNDSSGQPSISPSSLVPQVVPSVPTTGPTGPTRTTSTARPGGRPGTSVPSRTSTRTGLQTSATSAPVVTPTVRPSVTRSVPPVPVPSSGEPSVSVTPTPTETVTPEPTVTTTPTSSASPGEVPGG